MTGDLCGGPDHERYAQHGCELARLRALERRVNAIENKMGERNPAADLPDEWPMAAELADVNDKPRVSGLPTTEEIRNVYAEAHGGVTPWCCLNAECRRGAEAILALFAARVVADRPAPSFFIAKCSVCGKERRFTVEDFINRSTMLCSDKCRAISDKLAAPPTREELATVIAREFGPGNCTDKLADAILAAFGPKLRRQLSIEEWAKWLATQWIGHGYTDAEWNTWCVGGLRTHLLEKADALLAKLAELEQPVELDEEELAKALSAQVRPTENWFIVNEPTREECRFYARAATAYFRERANAVTKPEFAKPPDDSCEMSPYAQKLAAIYEAAVQGKTFEQAWNATARAVESEIRAAKREDQAEMRRMIAALDAGAITGSAGVGR